MTKLTADKSLQKAARVAGLAYLLIIVTSIRALWAFDTANSLWKEMTQQHSVTLWLKSYYFVSPLPTNCSCM